MSQSTRRAVVIVGSVLAILLVLALALPAVGRLAQSTETADHVLPEDLTALSLEVNAGDVTVRAAEAGESPGARARIRSGVTSPAAEVSTTGSTARISDTCRNAWWTNCSVSWTVVVPPAASVEVVSSVGEVTLVDLAGDVSVVSGVGGISATGLEGATFRARSGVGDVTLVHATAPDTVDVVSSTGDVHLTVPADDTGYRIVADSSIGDVYDQVGSDPAQSRVLEARTSVGDIFLRRADRQ